MTPKHRLIIGAGLLSFVAIAATLQACGVWG